MKPKLTHIRYRFFMVIAFILLFNILVTLIFGSTLMEKFYINNKENELRNASRSIAAHIEAGTFNLDNNDELNNAIWEAEQKNITVLLFTLKGQTAFVSYYSRGNHQPEKMKARFTAEDNKAEEFTTVNPFYQRNLEDMMRQAQRRDVFDLASLPLFVEENIPFPMLMFYETLGENRYLFLSTPREPIAMTAKLGVQYNLYISLATFILAAILTFFVTKRFTQPIADIDAAAQRISQMDFSQQVEIKTGDELEELSISINLMAEKLKAYIEQLELNQELLAKDLAREAKTNQFRRQFITNVSHDFKTPLALIQAYTEALSDDSLTEEEQKEYRQIILKENQRMNTLVTQLLQLSKLEGGVITLEKSIIVLEEMIREMVHHNQLAIKEKELSVVILPTEDHFALGDYHRIMQVMVNLLENAIKYTPPKGKIIWDVQLAANQRYRITITNTTEQLSEDELDNIFVSFYRKDSARYNDGKSFGLGLAIIKAIMNLHQEDCGAQNTTDGVQFYFELPAVTDL